MKKSEIKNIVWQKFEGRCAYCGIGIDIKQMQLDHIIPQKMFIAQVQSKKIPKFLLHLTINDVNHIDNLFPSCKYCNSYKSNFTLEEFRNYLNQMLNEKMERLFKSKTKMEVAIRMGAVKMEKWDGFFYFERLKTITI
jgi:endonuclease I